MRVKNRTGWSPEKEDTYSPDAPADAISNGPAGTDDGNASFEDSGHEQGADSQNSRQHSTVEIIQGLISSGREYAQIETERQKLRIAIIAAAMRYSALLGGVAIFLLLGILLALPIGAIWILSPYVGPLVATLIVFMSGIILVLLLLMLVRAKIRKVMRNLLSQSANRSEPQ